MHLRFDVLLSMNCTSRIPKERYNTTCTLPKELCTHDTSHHAITGIRKATIRVCYGHT